MYFYFLSVLSSKKFRKQIESVKRREAQLSLFFFFIGIVNGFFLTLIFEPLLQFVFYRLINYAVAVASLVAGFIVSTYLIYFLRQDLPLERALKLFFLGVSATSFFFALYNFVRFPNLIFAGGRPWITYYKEYHFPLGGNYEVCLSDIIYFIAKTLWSIFVGSLFAVLDRFWKLI